MTSSIKSPYLKKAMSDFKNFCTKIEMTEQPFRKYQKANFDFRRQLVPFDVLRHILFYYYRINSLEKVFHGNKCKKIPDVKAVNGKFI